MAFREGHWMLDMIEHVTNNCVMALVENRSAETLLPIIQQHVLPGTRIILHTTSCWTKISTITHCILWTPMTGHCTPTQLKVIGEIARQNSVQCMKQAMRCLHLIYKNTCGVVILVTMPLAISCIGYDITIRKWVCKLVFFKFLDNF